MTSLRRPTRDDCLHAAAEVYAGILTDPERAEQIRAHRARLAETERQQQRREAS
jgi:nitrate/TMAO reductase-like tetraheme cytochrome c subunit